MDKVIRARVSAELKEKFDLVCKENGYNASQLIRIWIENFIKENEKTSK